MRFIMDRRFKNDRVRIHYLTSVLAAGLTKLGYQLGNAPYFDTLRVTTDDVKIILDRALTQEINLRQIDDSTIGISLDETTTPNDVLDLWRVFAGDKSLEFTFSEIAAITPTSSLPSRQSEYLTHPVFNSYHSKPNSSAISPASNPKIYP